MSAATPPLLGLAGASVRFGSFAALKDVDVEIRRGEFVALVGSNGAGKTTLLHALHGLLPLSGTRRVAGDVSQAMVFQRPFMLRLSVLNNVRIALWLAGVPQAERAARARDALARAGLADRADRPARTLSGGQQQRLALARAWATRPDVLFLDEPTSNLDPAAKKEIEAMLAAFAADGMTLVMSTHNLGQAKRLATRVILVDAGEIRADLPSERFFAEHADLALRRAVALAESEELP
jgi:tungstate transport system ATP-binding protein